MVPLALLALAACAPLIRAECTTAHIHDDGDVERYSHCEALSGDLLLTCPPDAVRALSGLEALARVDGDVSLECDSLEGLRGLSGLEEVGGLVVLWASRADTLEGLEALRSTQGIALQHNDLLLDVSAVGGLEGMVVVQVEGNDALGDLDGMEVGEVSEAVRVWDNASLSSLAGLGLTTTGSVSIRSNPLLVSLDGLQELTLVEEDLEVDSCPELRSLDGLPEGLVVSGRVRLLGLTGLTDVGALGGASVHNLVLTGAGSLETLAGLEGWTSLSGGLTLADDPALVGLDGLSGLRQTGGSLTLEGLDGLTSVHGLASLEAVGGDLVVRSNSAMDQCIAEAWAASISVAGGTYVSDNGPCAE